MKRLILVCAVLWGSLGATAQSDAPYIYYYSRLLEGWVIERADGTDWRLFAQGVMPPEHLAVRKGGWSPSGEWFAWLSAPTFWTGGITTHVVWLVSHDGRRATFLEGIESFTDAYWSADGDVLYLVEDLYGDVTVYRADIAAGIVELVIGSDIEPQPIPLSYVQSNTGDFISSPDGRYQINPRTAELIDSVADTTVNMRRHSGYSTDDVCGVDWHPGGDWFMRHDSIIYAGGGCPYAIVVADATGTVQRELSACPLGGDCAGWLPEQVVSHLTPGAPHSSVPEPFLTLTHEGDMKGVGWRADGAAFATFEEVYSRDNAPRRLLIWTFDGESAALTKSIAVSWCFGGIVENCEVEWSPDGTRIALASGDDTQLVTIESGEIETSELHFAGWTGANEPLLIESFVDADYDSFHGRIARITTPDGDRNTVEVIDLVSGEIVYSRTFEPGRQLINSVNFLPDGSGLVLAVNADHMIWTFEEDALPLLISHREDYINDSRPYDRYILGFGRAGLTHIYDAATGARLARLNRYAYDAVLSPDGRTLATAGGQGVALWNMDDTLAP